MTNRTISEYIDFFRGLNFKEKVSIINQLTSILNTDMNDIDMKVEINKSVKPSESELIDELFGVWADNEELSESSIINRTISTKEIDLD